MSPQGIRLRLVIRRHAVPEVTLVWPCPATEDLTIAKLLSQVNDVVPLESGEWGLEDYAVELADGQGGTFECLHFQQVNRILKEDDQVLIRSLLTEDLRRRRLSGRHQITIDGRHLVDGIPFGRSWLRAPRDRPALQLPPRKRARITYDQEIDDEEANDSEEEAQEQLLLEAPRLLNSAEPGTVGVAALFEDADLDSGNEDEDADADFIDDFVQDDEFLEDDGPDEDPEEEEGNIDEELQLLRQDNAVIGDGDDHPSELPNLETISSSLGLNLESLDYITTLRTAFPLTPVTSVEFELRRRGRDLRRTYNALAKSNHPSLSFDDMMDRAVRGILGLTAPDAQESDGSDFGGFSSPVRPLIEEVESFDHVPNGASEVTTATLNASASANDEAGVESEDTSSSGSSSDSEDESSSDDNDDSSDSDDEDDDGSPTVLATGSNAQGPSSNSESSSDDSSDESSDEGNDGGASVDDAADEPSSEASGDVSSDDSSSSSEESDSSESEELPSTSSKSQPVSSSALVINKYPAKPFVPPGQGLSKTQKRNARRREHKRLRELEGAAEGGDDDESQNAELAARKAALLSSFGDDTPENTPNKPQSQGRDEMVTEAADQPQTAQSTPQDTSAGLKEGSAQRRLRMDLGAGRRMLFGALGLKTPKSKADEDKIKEGLMKGVRPLKNQRTEEPAEIEATTDPDADEPDSWKHKINYRAVECCYEGMVLSEPPFPFVQRWDPQQNFGSMRKRKRDSQNFDDSYYYDEDSQMYNEEAFDDGSAKKKSKKRKPKNANRSFEATDGDGDNIELNYDDAPTKAGAEGSQFTDVDDLPSLPSDLSTLPTLESGEAKPGMVITWKHMVLSKATSWQPQIVSVTALVLTGGDESTLRVVLAKRDREQDERLFDENTGKRIYDKFDAPDSDDDEGSGEDLGYRDVPWTDMGDARVVQQAPTQDMLNSPDKPGKAGETASDNQHVTAVDDSVEAVNALHNADAQPAEAHEAEGQQAEEGAEKSKKAASKDDVSSGSVSIQSGQKMPQLDFPMPVDDPSTGHSNDWVANGLLVTGDGINSPTRQLQETSQAAMLLDEHDAENLPDAAEQLDVPAATHLDDNDKMEIDGNDGDTGDSSAVVYPMLTIPSSVGSPRSGRQPQSQYGDSLDQVDDAVIPETAPQAHETTPTPKDEPPTGMSSGSSSPFPSLEEIFHTATTSRQTQSPAIQMSAVRSRKNAKRDVEYEEAMRRLDEGDESDRTPDKNKSIRSLFPNATQPSPSVDTAATPTKPKRKTRGRRSSPFEIPEGSQVVTLSSNPPSPVAENYAEDSIDETYDAALPKGSEGVKKNQPKHNTRARGKSLPSTAPAAAKKGRRKASSRF